MKRLLCFFLVLSAAAAVGCSDSDSPELRAFLASPDAPRLDVTYPERTLLSESPFLSFGNYLGVRSGTNTVVVSRSSNGDRLTDAAFSLADDGQYTVVVSDVLAQITAVLFLDLMASA